jgi:hypothetical protein
MLGLVRSGIPVDQAAAGVFPVQSSTEEERRQPGNSERQQVEMLDAVSALRSR